MGLAQNVKALYRGAAPLGIRVLRPVNAADLDAAAPTSVPMFRVNSGDILLTSIYGIVTAEMATADTTIKFQHDPAPGGAPVDMCDAHASITDDLINTIYTITGLVGDAMQDLGDALVGEGRLSLFTNLQILVPGIIYLVVGGATNTGEIEWTLHYVPLEEFSAVEPL